MSFSSNVKAELCKLPFVSKGCVLAECFGILLYCNAFQNDRIRIVTENPDFSRRLPKLFRRALGVAFDRTPDPAQQGGKQVFEILDASKLCQIRESFGFSAEGELTLHVNYSILEDEACGLAFLRGAFLSGGSVTDPEKRYHLELSTTHYLVGRETHALMLDLSMDPKQTTRGGNLILYFKQSDSIEDFLTAIGAPVSAMEIMETRVEKELINGVNRRVNCETANLGKVVDAAQEQLAAIARLEQRGQLTQLPEKLRQTAQLRRENPEAALTELAQMLDPPVTKSAINHRMRKILELSKG